MTAIPASQPRPADPIGSIGWTERTGGVLTARECLTLARPLLRGELGILAGRLAMALQMHSGRRSSLDPAGLVPPDSSLARDAEVAAQDLLTPALLNHSSRAYTWGAAIAALHGITFDRELLYVAAMLHDTGIPSPVPDVDFTVRSAAVAREFTDSHEVPADKRELVANAIAMHHTPASASNPVPRPTSSLPAHPSMCSACAAMRYPTQFARASSRSTRGWASSGSSRGFCEPKPSKSLAAAPGTCIASP